MDSELSIRNNRLFEELKETHNGVECWDARKLMPHVGYANWRDFHNAIKRAMQASRTNGEVVENQFLRVSAKTSPKGGRPGDNYLLTRRACYLVFQNGDPKVPGVAAAQAYFAQQTIRQEKADQRTMDWKRMGKRDEIRAVENAMTKVLLKHDVNTRQVAAIRSNGDAVLFGGNKTADMKKKLGVPEKRALADFLPLVIMTVRSAAAGITAVNTEKEDLKGFSSINQEHVKNNKDMREILVKNSIVPEDAPAATDIEQLRVKYGLSSGPRKPTSPGQMSLF